MPRADLQEDPVGNDDEIRCRIRIHTNDIPVDITEVLTSEQVLVG
jgi:hypothetical protein